MGGTPGPWDFAAGDLTVRANRLAVAICQTIGDKPEMYSKEQEAEAIHNFNLLQAAPQLLEALQSLLSVTPGADGDHMGLSLDHVAALDSARNAIRKAQEGNADG